MKIHPLADRYPMLSDDEIADLADDIKANGQKIPILIDGDTLLDGRNRWRACELAGVEPRTEPFMANGKDREAAIVAEITSRNLKRRHLNAGQRAILYALAYPEPTPGKRTDLAQNEQGADKPNSRDLWQARTIVNRAPDLVDQVIAGGMYFKTAFEEADKRRKAAELVASQMKQLQAEASDLHAIVLEEKGMTAAEAIAALDARKKQEAEKQSQDERKAREEAARLRAECAERTALLQRAITVFNPRGNDPEEYAARLFSEIDVSLWPAGTTSEASLECWNAAAQTLTALVKHRKGSIK